MFETHRSINVIGIRAQKSARIVDIPGAEESIWRRKIKALCKWKCAKRMFITTPIGESNAACARIKKGFVTLLVDATINAIDAQMGFDLDQGELNFRSANKFAINLTLYLLLRLDFNLRVGPLHRLHIIS